MNLNRRIVPKSSTRSQAIVGAIARIFARRFTRRAPTLVSPGTTRRSMMLVQLMLGLGLAISGVGTTIAQSCYMWVDDPAGHYFYAPTAEGAANAADQFAYSTGNQSAGPAFSCAVTSGNISLGTAAETCQVIITCGPPQCTVQGSYQTQTGAQQVGSPPCPTANNFFGSAGSPAGSDQGCANCVGDPINPASAIVFKPEDDFNAIGGSGTVSFKRFYGNINRASADLGPGWSHSYGRSISVNNTGMPVSTYSGGPTQTSEYSDPVTACVAGFPQIQSQINGWQHAVAKWAGNLCLITVGATTIGNLPIQATSAPPNWSSPVEYDAIRDDGQVVRFTVQGGVVTAPPGSQLTLKLISGGYTLIDESDAVETYNSSGVLQSIKSRSGVVQTLVYNAGNRLSTVTDSFGFALSLTYDASNRLSTVTAVGNGTVQYGYDSQSRLSTVTYPDTAMRTFLYENASYPTALTGVLDENSSRLSTWAYDSLGRATSSQQAGGAYATTLAYNSDGTVTSTDALGAVRTFTYKRVGDRNRPASISGSQCATCIESASTTYDNAGFVSSRTDYNGNLTCYLNDQTRGLELVRVEGLASGSTCPTNFYAFYPQIGTSQRKIQTDWHSTYQLPMTITEDVRTTTFTYDSSGNQLTKKVTDNNSGTYRTWTYTYDSYGHVLTAKSPRTDVNGTTTYVYYTCTSGYQCGRVNTATNAVGQVTTYNSYNAYGQPLTITDPNGVVTTLTYDGRQRLSSRQVGTETISFAYYPTGQLKKITLPDTSYIQYTYDAAHRLTQINDAAGNKITYTLDALGNRTAENAYDPTSVLSRTHTRVFNTLSQLYQDIGAANTPGVTTTFAYDSNGNQTTANAPLSRNTANQFDELNRLKQVTDPATGVTKLTYDSINDLTKVTDPRNLVTTYTYDGFGGVTRVSSPDTGSTSSTYDSGGNLATSTDARNAVATYTYDAANRVTSVAYAVGGTTDQTISYTYDAGTNGKGRLTGASDSNHSMTWVYDGLGRVTSKGQTLGTVTKTVGYTYTNGDLTTLTTPSGQSVVYSYTNGHVTGITINGTTLLSSVAYEPFGPARGWTWGNASTEVRLHNTDGNPSQISAVESSTYGYDNALRITGITNSSNSALSWTYGYDLLDRLTSATKTGTTQGWTYDADGNRLTQTGTVTGTYTPSTTSNRLNSIAGTPARTYSYDNAGNTLTYSNITFTYYNRGRMKTAMVGSSTTTYVYNALGQRIMKSGGSAGTVLTVFDEAGHLLGEYNSTGGLVQETVWLGDTPVATIRPGTPAVVYYVHADHINAPRMVTRPSDNKIAWRWDTDPFGSAAPNQNPQSLGTFVYNLRYPGQYYDSETGLNYNFHRDYDPQAGRYIESDPIGQRGGVNTYVFVRGNPIGYIDPNGTIIFNLGAAGVGAVIGGVAGGLTAYLQGGSGSDIAYATGIGALGGAVAGFTFGAAGTLVVGAVSGGLGSVAGQLVTTGSVDPSDVVVATGAGVVGGVAGIGAIAAGYGAIEGAAMGGLATAETQAIFDFGKALNNRYPSKSTCP